SYTQPTQRHAAAPDNRGRSRPGTVSEIASSRTQNTDIVRRGPTTTIFYLHTLKGPHVSANQYRGDRHRAPPHGLRHRFERPPIRRKPRDRRRGRQRRHSHLRHRRRRTHVPRSPRRGQLSPGPPLHPVLGTPRRAGRRGGDSAVARDGLGGRRRRTHVGVHLAGRHHLHRRHPGGCRGGQGQHRTPAGPGNGVLHGLPRGGEDRRGRTTRR